MMGRQNNQGIPGTRRSAEVQLPEARVVIGKHAPEWAAASSQVAADGNAISYVRMSPPASATLLAVVNSFWPVFVIVGMGIGLLWGGALANSP